MRIPTALRCAAVTLRAWRSSMRRLIVIAMATMPLLAVYGQPDQFLSIVGPRIGVSYVITSSLEFTEGVSNI